VLAPKKDGEDQAIGRSKGGLSTKIHLMVDALGNPFAFFLTGGQAHDLERADALLPQMKADTLLAGSLGTPSNEAVSRCAAERRCSHSLRWSPSERRYAAKLEQQEIGARPGWSNHGHEGIHVGINRVAHGST
jgi:hypothetical protein